MKRRRIWRSRWRFCPSTSCCSVLRFSTALIRILGEGGISLLARIAGLLLAAIAVQLIAESVRGFVMGA